MAKIYAAKEINQGRHKSYLQCGHMFIYIFSQTTVENLLGINKSYT